jgi:dipeptidyl aminopeptidase/acylaminoacyl peptidase
VSELLVRPIDSEAPITVARSPIGIIGPLWSADGTQIFYRVGRDLWSVGAAGGTPRPILPDASMASLTPDGGTLYFVRAADGAPWLFRHSLREAGDTTATGAQRIGATALPGNPSFLSPVAPDGSALIAASPSARWLIHLPDGAQTQLPSETGFRPWTISWFPDSRHLLIAEEARDLIGSRLVISDTRSAARRLVVSSVNWIQGATLSPDGRRLVYAGGPVDRDILEYSDAGTYMRTIAASSQLEGFPEWSPKGDRLVYRAGGPGQSDRIFVAAADGSSSVLLIALGSNSVRRTPISPDGGRLAVADGQGIRVVPLAGGSPVRVLAAASDNARICWSSDGEWIWYSKTPAQLARIPSGGGQPVTTQATEGQLLDCSPDGRWLLRRRRGGELVLTSASAESERQLAASGEYDPGGENTAQFGANGREMYLLRLDYRTIDTIDTQSGAVKRSTTFEIPPGDRISGFSFNADGKRVLLTIGGDRTDLWLVDSFVQPSTSWRRWFAHWETPAPTR